MNPIYYAAIAEVETGVKKSKLQNNQVSFDDLIANLHRALVKKDNPKLVTALQTKYKAVFIDEFQDTDRLQYEIFKQAFGTATVLFYIGDPKQSIYAWRKADIATYFNAYDDVANKYGMNENYRSSVSFIQAMNTFFLPVAGFDTFHFPEDEQSIQYIEVKSPDVNTKGQLQLNSALVVPISIWFFVICSLASGINGLLAAASFIATAAFFNSRLYSLSWSALLFLCSFISSPPSS